MYPLPSILVAPMVYGRQTEPDVSGVTEAVASPVPARIAASGDGCRYAALAVRIGAAVAIALGEVAQGRDGGGKAADTGFDV